jgi:hypothetical protein
VSLGRVARRWRGGALLALLAAGPLHAQAAGPEEAPAAEDSLLEDVPEEEALTQGEAVDPRDIGHGADLALEQAGPGPALTWAGHGAAATVPLAQLYLASRAGQRSVWSVATQSAAGALTGMLPARLAYAYDNPAEARWRELDVALLGLSLTLTPPLTALGTWGSGELLLGGSQQPGRAFLGAMGGALAGHFLGLALDGLLRQVLPQPELAGFRFSVSLALIGTSASLGYQWLGGGPR